MTSSDFCFGKIVRMFRLQGYQWAEIVTDSKSFGRELLSFMKLRGGEWEVNIFDGNQKTKKKDFFFLCAPRGEFKTGWTQKGSRPIHNQIILCSSPGLIEKGVNRKNNGNGRNCCNRNSFCARDRMCLWKRVLRIFFPFDFRSLTEYFHESDRV